jgi:hypothetical protein
MMAVLISRFNLVAGAILVVFLCAISTVRADKLIQMNFNDESGNQSLVNAGTISVTGTMVTNVSYSESRPSVDRAGYSASFNNLEAEGLNYISLGDHDEFDGMTNMTICLWVRPAVKVCTSWSQRLLNKGIFGWGLTLGGTYVPNLMVDGYTTGILNNGDVPLGHWTFIAVTYNGDLTTDNVLSYSGDGITMSGPTTNTLDRGSVGSNSSELRFGAHTDETGNSFHGKMDDVRVYNEILDAETIAAIMVEDDASASRALPPDVGKLIHLDFNNDLGEQCLTNIGSMALNEKFEGDSSYSAVTPAINKGGYSASFYSPSSAGTNYVSLTDGVERDELCETWQMTSCMWMRPEANMDYEAMVLSYQGSTGSHGWILKLANYGIVPQFNANGSGAGTIGSALTREQWQFIAVAYDGKKTTDNLLFYQGTTDTLSVTTNTFDKGMLRATGPDMKFWIGDDSKPPNDGGYPFHGQLDNVRVYNRALPLSELETIMAYDDVPPRGSIIIVK